MFKFYLNIFYFIHKIFRLTNDLPKSNLTEFVTTQSNLLKVRFYSVSRDFTTNKNEQNNYVDPKGWRLNFQSTGERNPEDWENDDNINKKIQCPTDSYTTNNGKV